MYTVEYEKFVLENGLNIILHEDNNLPLTAVNVWYHVGSKNEEIGKTGFAHLFEHMMFEGSKNHKHDYFDPLQKIGASINGSTTSDRTNYWENIPSNSLELALWLESDRMGFLLEAIDQKRFDTEREIVKNERRQSYENRPYDQAQLELQPLIFPNPHPYSWPVIGSQADLNAASLEDVKSFYRTFYSPSNASIAIAGKYDKNKTLDLINTYFGNLKPGQPIKRIHKVESPLKGEVNLQLFDSVQLPKLYLVWPSHPMFDNSEAPLDILASILGEGKSSRLHKLLVRDKQIARSVRIYNYGQELAGEFCIEIISNNPNDDLQDLQSITEDQIKKLTTTPPNEQEIERAKNRVKSDHISQLEHIGGFGGRADQLNHYNIFTNNPNTINTDLQRYMSVEPKDIQKAIKSTIGNNRVVLKVLPKPNLTSKNISIDRTKMPKPGNFSRFTPEIPERINISDNIDMLFLNKPGIPLTSTAIVFKGGSNTDPQTIPGLNHITSRLITEGTTNRKSEEIHEQLEFMASTLNTNTYYEHTVAYTQSLNENSVKTQNLLSDILTNANFPDIELARLKKQELTDIKRISDDPVALSRLASRAIIYNQNYPLSHPTMGTESSLQKIDREASVAQYNKTFLPETSTILVVAGKSKSEVTSEIKESLSSWLNKKQKPYNEVKTLGLDSIAQSGPSIYILDKPNSPQSVIRAGMLTIKRTDPDYFAMTLINYIFGGQPTSRLFKNLRQDKGYSYGYYSTIEWSESASLLLAGGSVETKVTKESIVETLKEYQNISHESPITPTELNVAKQGILKGYASNFQTQDQYIDNLARIALYDLPLDYHKHYLKNINDISLGQVREVSSSKINLDNLAIIVVGDRKLLLDKICEIGIPVHTIDVSGKILSKDL